MNETIAHTKENDPQEPSDAPVRVDAAEVERVLRTVLPDRALAEIRSLPTAAKAFCHEYGQ